MEEDFPEFHGYRAFVGSLGLDSGDGVLSPRMVHLYDQFRSGISDSPDHELIAILMKMGSGKEHSNMIIRNIAATEYGRRHGQQMMLCWLVHCILTPNKDGNHVSG